MKKHWVNPDCQNSEPTKRTVSISANEKTMWIIRKLFIGYKRICCIISEIFPKPQNWCTAERYRKTTMYYHLLVFQPHFKKISAKNTSYWQTRYPDFWLRYEVYTLTSYSVVVIQPFIKLLFVGFFWHFWTFPHTYTWGRGSLIHFGAHKQVRAHPYFGVFKQARAHTHFGAHK